jgi:uncharacterized protein YgiM (DUF1202 family)
MPRRAVIILFSVSFLFLLSLSFSLVNQVRAEFGTGWRAEFYSDTDLSDREATIENVNGINFNWDNDQPEVNGEQIDVGPDDFSVRFTSNQNFAAGTYQFVVAADDGARVIIDGQTVLDEFRERPLTTNTFNLSLSAGSHSITVEHVQFEGRSSIQFQWFLQGSGGAPTGVVQPTSGPSPTPGPTATPAPTSLPPIPPGALTATVIRAPILLVRNGPFLGAEVVGRIRRGETYAIVGRDPDARWYLLQLSGYQAWAFSYYLFVNGNEFSAPSVSPYPASATGVIVQSRAAMRLRSLPTTESDQIGRVPWGEIMPLLGRTRDSSWWQVDFRGTTGWVYAPYLRIIEGDIGNVPIVEV